MKHFTKTGACKLILPAFLLYNSGMPLPADAGSNYGMGAKSRAKIYTKTLGAKTRAAGARDGVHISKNPGKKGDSIVSIQSKRNGGCADLNVASVPSGQTIDGDIEIVHTGTVINVCK